MLARNILRLTSAWKNSAISARGCFYRSSYIENIEDGDKVAKDDENKSLTELNINAIQTFETNKEILNGVHAIKTIQSLTRSYWRENDKNKKYKNQTDKTSSSKEYFLKTINSIIDSNIDKLTASEALRILEDFNRKNLLCLEDIHTYLLLKHIYKYVDDLSFVEYSMLSTIMRNVPGLKIVKSINRKISSKFLMKLSRDFEENNIIHLEHAFTFICHNLESYKVMTIFINKLQNYKGDIPLKSLIIILESLCSTKVYPHGWLKLLHRLYDGILKSIDEIDAAQINYVLYIISTKLRSKWFDEMYKAQFLDKLIQKLISVDPGFESALSALKCLSYIRHVNKELINYTSASYFEKTILNEQNIEQELGKLLVLINGLAIAKHKTIFWNEIEKFILNNDSVLHYDYKTLCILSFNLVYLDCYPIQILEKVFDGKYDYSNNEFLFWTFCKIYQKLKTDPTYNGPMPSKSQIGALQQMHKRFVKNKKEHHFQLLPHLEEGLGGPIYVKSNISTKLFHVLDHVIVFQKNGLPVPINTTAALNGIHNKIEYVEDLDVPPGCQIIAILNIPYYWYISNSDKLLGIHQITVDTLETMSYKVVPINKMSWMKNIPDNEKTSFLMDEIKSRLNKIE